jgi:hypothetical protein
MTKRTTFLAVCLLVLAVAFAAAQGRIEVRKDGTSLTLAADGRPLDAIATELVSLDRVELDAVNEMARSGLYDWGSLLVLLVGDADSLTAQLEAAGFPRPELNPGVDGP